MKMVRSISFATSLLLHVLLLLVLRISIRKSSFASLGAQSKSGFFALELGQKQEKMEKARKNKIFSGAGEAFVKSEQIEASQSSGASNGQVEAKLRGNLSPEYPAVSRELGEHGDVELSFAVGGNGRAEDVLVSRSSGYRRLDAAAMRAVRAAEFEASTGNDRKKLRVVFELK